MSSPLFDTVADNTASLRLALPPDVLAQLLVRVLLTRTVIWQLAADKVGNPTCIHSVPSFHISWLWFSPKLLVNWKLFMGFAGLVNRIVSQSNWNLDQSCVREVARVYTRERRESKLLNYQSCFFPPWASVMRSRNHLSATERGVAEGMISILLLQTLWIQKAKISPAWWSRWAGCLFNSWKCSHSHFGVISSSIICPEILCLRWEKSVGAQLRRLPERSWNKRTEP